MRSLEQILHEKEMQLARLRQQVEALRFVAPLLMEQRDFIESVVDFPVGEQSSRNRWPLNLG